MPDGTSARALLAPLGHHGRSDRRAFAFGLFGRLVVGPARALAGATRREAEANQLVAALARDARDLGPLFVPEAQPGERLAHLRFGLGLLARAVEAIGEGL